MRMCIKSKNVQRKKKEFLDAAWETGLLNTSKFYVEISEILEWQKKKLSTWSAQKRFHCSANHVPLPVPGRELTNKAANEILTIAFEIKADHHRYYTLLMQMTGKNRKKVCNYLAQKRFQAKKRRRLEAGLPSSKRRKRKKGKSISPAPPTARVQRVSPAPPTERMQRMQSISSSPRTERMPTTPPKGVRRENQIDQFRFFEQQKIALKENATDHWDMLFQDDPIDHSELFFQGEQFKLFEEDPVDPLELFPEDMHFPDSEIDPRAQFQCEPKGYDRVTLILLQNCVEGGILTAKSVQNPELMRTVCKLVGCEMSKVHEFIQYQFGN